MADGYRDCEPFSWNAVSRWSFLSYLQATERLFPFVGLTGAKAASAVLLFRLATFWLLVATGLGGPDLPSA